MLWLSAGYRSEPDAMATELTPVELRAQDRLFVTQCSLQGLRDRLPLCWPAPAHTPPSPKRAYRSAYIYLGWQDLQDASACQRYSDFDLLLRLVDCSALRPVLAQRLGWTSARGWKPFDPLSIFLLVGWQITNAWSRTQTLRNLRDPRYADYAQRFGFRDGCFPTEGGVRHFLHALGQHSTAAELVTVDQERGIQVAVQHLNELLIQSVTLIRQAGLLSAQAWEKALICPDGMLHQAASALRCSSVQETCYQPTSPSTPRLCPAKHKQRRGCDCDRPACAQICRQATPRDPQARFVQYSASNRADDPNRPMDPAQDDSPRGKAVYGYRTFPLQLADPVRRFSLILLDDFRPANEREENPVAALLLQLHTHYPTLQVDAVAGDAAFGYDLPLRIIYEHLHARRVIDLRSHPTDHDQSRWPIRGYDDRGRPVCAFGYGLTANGFDRRRQRHKWVCAQACRNGARPIVQLPAVTYPPVECPYRNPQHPLGRIINVAERFADGSLRLVRDLPLGTPEWNRLYRRGRNAVESRNSTFEYWGLKRLSVYGAPRSTAFLFLADLWSNLTTLARLVQEATAASTT